MLLNAADSLVVIVDVQEKLAPVIHQRDQLIARMRWLGEIANELDVPIVVTEQYSKGLGISVDDLSGVIENARVIEKLHFSAWQEPNFADVVQQQNKRQVVLMGMEGHVCILQTASDLKEAGYDVFVVEDAVGSRRDSDKQSALARLRQLGVQIVTSEMVAYEWMHRSGTDTFRHITKNWIRG
ncbi:hydrolase [Pseudidiomarina terrestris]|uniref:Hydrolase n=1 Tax=Pseudidiomarina terrestris TaxID=2820060 RepID=A0AAW7R2A8_9GAMM|nr:MULTISPECIES: hydrolase [unclassified Pseudidiomarina]MDN7125424.1 hydrolase [Pseudidiomarina sp. 1APP75-32.1]MDN7128028.1 hydrolase [Pseudidiomarina sp. 1APR75-33.1]MDN7130182.1 hydrolase [Pseudidiomarina sp. 1APR75-15]MDN7135687.1 hydrolase [Pseudidiomarina sp. 1ASP75-5]MDN7137275.1 hydrolase [Pseudidiomarina sp. 1ASP75-14]